MKNESKTNIYEVIGKILIKLQILEIQIKLFISFLNPEVKLKYKIGNIDSRSIMDNSENSRKTLGNLMHILKSELPFFINDDFNKLLKLRNTFVHSFHSKYLNNKNIKFAETKEYLEEIDKLTENFARIFTGLNTLSVKIMAKKKLSLEDYEKIEFYDLEKNEKIFFDFLKKHIK
jgi:hypothetical protein